MNIYDYLTKDLYVAGVIKENPDGTSSAVVSQSSVGNGGSETSPESIVSGEIDGNLSFIGGFIQSKNFVSGTSGWRLSANGTLEGVNAILSGTIVATSGTIGGFTISATTIASTNLTLDSAGQRISLGSANDIIILDADDATYRLWIGHATAASAPFSVTKAGAATASSITITGGSITGTPIASIPNNSSTDISLLDLTHDLVFSVTDADTVAWASGTITMSNGRTFSISAGNTGNMAARTYIYLDTGVSSTVLQTTTTVSTAMGANKKLIAVAQNGSGQPTYQVYAGLGGLKIGSAGINISNNNWTYSGTWSVTDADTVAWGAGTLKVSDGTSYSITGSNTGNMAAKTYIYFDLAVSSTAFQTTTTATTAIGDGKILIAIAQNGTTEANYMAMNDKQHNIDAANIVAGSITANEIAAGAITATKISVSTLSAITADMGTLTAGTITLNSSGHIKSGQSAYNTGSGFWLGYDSGVAKFSIGDPTGRYLTWDGSTLTINGYVQSNKGAFGGDGSDGALSITSGTTTIDCSSAATLTKHYTSISITSTGVLTFSNPHANGTLIKLKSQGNVTLTSTATACIEGSELGAAAGTSGISTGTSALKGGSGQGGTGAGVASEPGGDGGIIYLNISGKSILFGAGAGGGDGAGSFFGGTAGTGGRGGAAIVIECGGAYNFGASSTIKVNGGNGGNGSSDNVGGGGGGGGGTILVIYNTLTANSGTYVATGGTGGDPGTNSGGSGGTGQLGGGSTGNGGTGGTGGTDRGGGGSGGGGGGGGNNGSAGASNGVNGGGGGGGGGGAWLIVANTEFP